MISDVYQTLLNAVSPFDLGVSPLKLNSSPGTFNGQERPQKTAAVLVPVLDKPEPEILLTVRSETLPQHAGQVCFPGDAVDRKDRSAISTALREAEEEIGLDFSQVSPLGFLDRLDTISNYRVLPVVGLVHPAFVWRPDEREVAEVFTVPLHLAVNRSEYTHHDFIHDGSPAVTSSLHWKGHMIWGITATILLNLGRRLEKTGEFQ